MTVYTANGERVRLLGSPSIYSMTFGDKANGELLALSETYPALFNADVRMVWTVNNGLKCGSSLFRHSLEQPSCIAMSSSKRVYVSGSKDNKVPYFDMESGKYKRTGCLHGDLHSPSGVEVDQLDNVLVANTGNNTVQVFFCYFESLIMIDLIVARSSHRKASSCARSPQASALERWR